MEAILIKRRKTAFLADCQSIGITGGRKISTLEVLEREAKKGNTRAKKILEKWTK